MTLEQLFQDHSFSDHKAGTFGVNCGIGGDPQGVWLPNQSLDVGPTVLECAR
jgi:hypothetical protein